MKKSLIGSHIDFMSVSTSWAHNRESRSVRVMVADVDILQGTS